MFMGFVAIIDDEDTDLCPRGNGKTCSLTFYLYLRHLQGYEIWTNYYTTFSKRVIGFQEMIDSIRQIREQEDLNNIPKIKRRKVVFGVSELQDLINSVGSSNAQVLFVDSFTSQIRKLDVDCFYDTQVLKHLHKRVRRHTENIRVPIKYHYNGVQCNFDRCEKPHIILVHSYKPFRKYPIRKIRADKVGPMYNTDERIYDKIKLDEPIKQNKRSKKNERSSDI